MRSGSRSTPQLKIWSREGGRPEWLPLAMLVVTSTAAWAAAVWVRIYSPFEMKLIHALVFFIWTLCFSALWRRTLCRSASHWVEIIVPVLAAICAEVVQIWIPAHKCNWEGLFASLCGILLASVWIHARRPSAEATAVVRSGAKSH